LQSRQTITTRPTRVERRAATTGEDKKGAAHAGGCHVNLRRRRSRQRCEPPPPPPEPPSHVAAGPVNQTRTSNPIPSPKQHRAAQVHGQHTHKTRSAHALSLQSATDVACSRVPVCVAWMRGQAEAPCDVAQAIQPVEQSTRGPRTYSAFFSL
jgi:hypothetical protein